ncbi:MAG: hypothetical protein KDA37_10770, partial [Planctomycetales bacterium]|nr:hypothetical protein [Planctomycetales bacterium]
MLFAGVLLAMAAPQPATAQPADAPAGAEATQPADSDGAERPAAESAESDSAEGEAQPLAEVQAAPADAAPAAGIAEEVAAPDAAQPTAKTEGSTLPAASFDWIAALTTLAVLILPIVIGNWLGVQLKMPDYGWKISLLLVTIAVSAYCVATRPFKGGVDLNGGVTLIYEVEDKSLISQGEDGQERPAAAEETRRSVKIS